MGDPRRRRRPERLLLQHLGRDQAEAHGVEHRRERIALHAEPAREVAGQHGGRAPRQVPDLPGDAFRDVQAEQHRAGGQPAHGLGEAARPVLARRHGDEAAAGQLRRLDAAQQRPQLRAQRHRLRLHGFRHEQRVAARTDADALQLLAQVGADVGVGAAHRQAQFLAQPEGRAAQGVVLGGLALGGEDRAELALDEVLQPGGQAFADAFALRAIEEFGGQHLDLRLGGFRAGLELRDLGDVAEARGHVRRMRIGPGHLVRGRQREGVVLGGFQHRDAARDLGGQRAAGGAQHDAAFFFLDRRGIGFEGEALHGADRMALDHHLAAAGDGGEQFLLGIVHLADQVGGAAVDEARGQGFVQRVAHHVLGAPRIGLQPRRVVDPVVARGDIGPDADGADARHQGIEVAIGAFQHRQRSHQPVARQLAVARQVGEQLAAQRGVAVIGQLAEIRHLAGFPQQPHARHRVGQVAHIGVARQCLERDVVDRVVAFRQPGLRRACRQAAQQRVDAGEIQVRIPPGDLRDRLEGVGLDGGDDLIGHGGAFGRRAEGPVLHAAPGTPGDLRDFLRGQRAGLLAVELLQRGEGDMVDIHVQAHADRVGRDQEIDLAVLVQRDLRVARARRQPAHHHRAAAAAAANGLGDGVDLVRAEGDDGGPRGQAGQLGRPCVGELGQARARLDLGARHQAAQQRRDGLGAEEHGLDHAARMQQPVGEDMPAIGIGTELDFIDREEFDRAVERHGLHRAGEPLRLGRDDLLLAGDQRDVALALLRHHAVVVLARQQAQREADDAGGMREQSLDREMRLAGIGGAEDGADPRFEHGAQTFRNGGRASVAWGAPLVHGRPAREGGT
ncbi:hypothetical protein ROS9278_04677 [Roseomonas sp. CECT 9278]|nr:hypothetical protein ROS9278_04677 [Roseomonas sp. CECT 9278]